MTTLIQTSTPWLSAEWQLGTQERTLLSCLLLFLKELVSIISPTWSVFFPPSHLLIWFGGLRCDEWANANLSLYHTRVKRLTWQELRRATMSCSTAGWMQMCDKDQYLAGSSPQHELKSWVTVLAWEDSSTWWHTARTGRLSQPSSLTPTTPSRNLPRTHTSPPAWRLQKQTSLILQLALQALTFHWNFTMYNLSLGLLFVFYELVPSSISAYQRYDGAASESLQLCFCVSPGKSVNNSKLIHNHFRDSVICISHRYLAWLYVWPLEGISFALIM